MNRDASVIARDANSHAHRAMTTRSHQVHVHLNGYRADGLILLLELAASALKHQPGKEMRSL